MSLRTHSVRHAFRSSTLRLWDTSFLTWMNYSTLLIVHFCLISIAREHHAWFITRERDQSWSLRWNHLTTNSEAAPKTLAPPATPIPMWYMAGPVRPRTFWEYSFNANAMGVEVNVMGAVMSQMMDNESEKSLSPTTSDSTGPRAEKKMPPRAPFVS